MREDNLLDLRSRLLVSQTTYSKHAWRVVPNLVQRIKPINIDYLWIASLFGFFTVFCVSSKRAYIVTDGSCR